MKTFCTLALVSLAALCGSVVSDACAQFCPMDFNPMCGSDGKSYANTCELEKVRCNNPALGLTIAGEGECSPTGANPPAATPGGGPRKHCPKTCTEAYTPRCGSDGITYTNACKFSLAYCENQALSFMTMGACPGEKKRH